VVVVATVAIVGGKGSGAGGE